MTHKTIRTAGVLLVGLLAAAAAHASGGSSTPTPTTPEETAVQLSDQYYNEGLAFRDKAWKLEEQLAAASDEDKDKIGTRIQKNYRRAIASYRDAIKINADNYKAASSLGYALRKTGSFEEAIASYDKALAIEPGYAEAIEYRGEAYLGLNRIDDAKEAYMQLFGSDRGRADELLAAMQKWLGAGPQDVDASTLEAFASWVDERSEIASNTTPVSRLHEKSW